MQGKITSECPIYAKKEAEGERTSKFVPSGPLLQKGERIFVSGVEEDHTGKFLLLADGPHAGKYVDQAYTDISLASA